MAGSGDFALGAVPPRRPGALPPVAVGGRGGPRRGLAAGAGLSLNVGIDLDASSASVAVAEPLAETRSAGSGTLAPGLSVTANQEMGHAVFGTLAAGGEATQGTRMEGTTYSLGSDTLPGAGGAAGAPSALTMGKDSVTMSFGGGSAGATIVGDADEAAFLAAMGGSTPAPAPAAAAAGAGDSSDDDDIWGPKPTAQPAFVGDGSVERESTGGGLPALGSAGDLGLMAGWAGEAPALAQAPALAPVLAPGLAPLDTPAGAPALGGSMGAALGFQLNVGAVNAAARGGGEEEEDEGLLAGWARGEEVVAPAPAPLAGAGSMGAALGLAFDVGAVNAAAGAAGGDEDDEGLLAGWARGGGGEDFSASPAVPSDVADALIGFGGGGELAADKYEMGEEGLIHLGGKDISERGLHEEDGSAGDPATSFKNTSVRVDVLGAGASGRVYKTVHVPSLTVVAVKTIPMYDPSKRHRLEEEFKALYHNMTSMQRIKASAETETAGVLHRPGQALPRGDGTTAPNVTLQHVAPCPFITSFFDVFTDVGEGTMNFVMEYMDAGSLDDFVAVGPCRSESTLANISFRILKGLHFLHSHKCIHRDLKPENVLLNHYGHVKLADFGIIREMTHTAELVSTFIGTLFYMSPERVAGKPYSYASDIWAFGMTVLTVALGHFPYGEKCAYFELMSKLQEEEPPALPAEHFSDSARDFFRRALQRDPAARDTASQLLAHPWLVTQRAAERAHQQEFGLIPPPPAKDTAVPEQTMHDLDNIVRTVQLYRMTQAKRRARTRLRQVHPSRLVWLSQQTQIPLHIVQYKFKQTTRVINEALARKARERSGTGGAAAAPGLPHRASGHSVYFATPQ